MKQLLKQYLTVTLITILFLVVSSTSVFASNYGDCGYGEGNYNEGCVESTTTTTGSSGSNTSSSEPSAPVCSDQAPGNKTPWLYAATAQNGTSILLYFTDADDPVSYYALEFGSESGNYTWSSTNIGGKGMRTYLVEHLQPNKTYYFRVRGGNGCAPGEWSNEISAKTKGAVSFNQFETKDLTLEPVITTKDSSKTTGDEGTGDGSEDSDQSDSETTTPESYKVNIKVKDDNDQPVAGAKVTMHSEVQEATTDEEGIARFENVEPGEHRVLVAYDGYEGEQSLNLTGDNEEFNLTITIKKQNVLTSPIVLAIIGGFSLLVIVLAILLFRKPRNT